MKFIKVFIASVVAIFSLQFATASAATPDMTTRPELHAGTAASAQQHHRKPIRHRHRRVHRHHKK
jgi:hypothetical protein